MECRNHHATETQLSAAKGQQQQIAREVSKEKKEGQLQKHAIETGFRLQKLRGWEPTVCHLRLSVESHIQGNDC
jgi:hypothetical protein